MTFRLSIFFLFCFLSVQTCIAQVGTTLKASLDKHKILIGERLQLTVEANLPPQSVATFVNIDSIKHFELLDKPVIDTIDTNGGTIIKGVYTITSFDSGHWVIPAFILSPGIKTDTIPVDVVFAAFDPNQDYHDIKDIIEVNPAKKRQGWLYVIGGGVLLLLIIVMLWRRKKKLPVPIPAAPVNAYEEAMKQLARLHKEKPETKQYHSQLIDVFRLYIFRKKGILSLQKTTDDLVIQLRNLGLGKDQFERLAQALRLGDFVKFAKYIPSGKDDEDVFETIKRSIDEIEKMN